MEHFLKNAFLISYPKSGRTWIRVILAKLLELEGGEPSRKELIRYRHDGFESHMDRQPWYVNKRDKSKWKGKDIILLLRDPVDIVVSYYFQMTKREKRFDHTLSEFIRDYCWGIYQIISWMNSWTNQKDVERVLTIKYEDLIKNCFPEMIKIRNFLGLKCELVNLRKATLFASFENMRKIEIKGAERDLLSNVGALRCLDKSDSEAFKVRRGKVGGWKDYITSVDDLRFVTMALKLLNKRS